MGEMIKLNGPDGSFTAYVARPDSTPAPGLVLIQEIFGINYFMREVADYWARRGFLTLVPDLFWRLEPGVELDDRKEEDWTKAFDLMQRFDKEKGTQDIQFALAELRRMEGCTGKAGTIGYCLGGHMAYRAAVGTDADASVGYYGVGLDEMVDQSTDFHGPLLLHIAAEDKFVPKAAQEKVIGALEPRPEVTLFRYEGVDHAFARRGSGTYVAETAEVADNRTQTFLDEHLR